MNVIDGDEVTRRVWAMLATERWAQTHRGYYEVSTFGQVRRAQPGIATFVGRPLRGIAASTGYVQVSLHDDTGSERRLYLHQVVMAAFVGPCPDGMLINHRNGDKHDNRLSNLEYVTPSANTRHALTSLPPRRRGPLKPVTPLKGAQVGDRHWSRRRPDLMARGERMGTSKLTAEIVVEIRQRAATGDRGIQKVLAAEFGISVAHVSRLVHRKEWRHV